MNNVLTVTEAAAFIPCSTRQIYRLIREKKLEGTFYRVNKRIYFLGDELKEWQKEGGTSKYENND